MQNTMLDSTISTLNQDKSSVEYSDARENPIALKDLPPEAVINDSLITQKHYRMYVANLFGFEARVIVTNPKDIKDPRSTWWCLSDTGNVIGSSKSGSLLGLLRRRERDSRIFTNDEIIFDDFGRKDTLPLNNRGQTFVSLSGFLEILSKTELSSDKVDDFQEEIFGRVLPQLAFEGKAEVSDEYKEKIGIQQPQFAVPKTLPEALRAYADEVERREAAERRAITAEAELTSEKEAHEKDNEDFKAGLDIINAQKAQISSTQVATAMATASSAKAHQRFAEKVLETRACELITLRAVADERRSQLWDANRTAHEIYKLKVLKKEYSMNTLENKARRLLSHFTKKLGERPIQFPNGSTYPDSFGRLQPSMSTYYEKSVADAALNWVIEHPNDFPRIGGKRDPLTGEW